MPEMEMGWESLVHSASETNSCFFYFTLHYGKLHNSLATPHFQWLIPKYRIKKKNITREELKTTILEHKGHNWSHEKSICLVFRLHCSHKQMSRKYREGRKPEYYFSPQTLSDWDLHLKKFIESAVACVLNKPKQRPIPSVSPVFPKTNTNLFIIIW